MRHLGPQQTLGGVSVRWTDGVDSRHLRCDQSVGGGVHFIFPYLPFSGDVFCSMSTVLEMTPQEYMQYYCYEFALLLYQIEKVEY